MKKLLYWLIFRFVIGSQKWNQKRLIDNLIKSKELIVGDNTYGIYNLNIKRYKGSYARVSIGKFCSIAENVVIITGGIHPLEWISTYPLHERILGSPFPIGGMPYSKGDIVIGNDVWVASNVTIMSGVKIGDGAVLTAGAIVTKDVPSFSVAGGIPAKIIKHRFTAEQIRLLLEISWWNWPIDRIIDNIDLLSSTNIEEFINIYNPDKK